LEGDSDGEADGLALGDADIEVPPGEGEAEGD
jgi:hypothetical protein